MAFAEDLSVFFDPQGLGLPVVCGDKQATGIRDTRLVTETDAGGYGVQVRRTVLFVPAGAIGAPAMDAPITVGGAAYVVRGPADVDDADDVVEAFVLAKA